MSFGVYQQLTRSTVIDICLVSSYTHPDALNIILSRGTSLEVYDAVRGQLTYSLSLTLFGTPEAIGAFRPRPDGSDHLAIVFQHSRYLAVLRHQPELGFAQTCGQHILMAQEDTAVVAGILFRPSIAVDPGHRCIAVRTMPERISLYPVSPDGVWEDDTGVSASTRTGQTFQPDHDHPPGLRAPFTVHIRTALRLQELSELVFLGGYYQPTMACMGQLKPGPPGFRRSRGGDDTGAGGTSGEAVPEDGTGLNGSARDFAAAAGNTSVLIVTIDLAEKAPHVVWATRNVLGNAFRLLPLMDPVGGLLVLADNAVLYFKEHGPSFCQTLNPAAELSGEVAKLPVPVKDEAALGIALAGCSVTVVSPTVVLFSIQPSGRLYLAHLVLESKDVVTDIVWTSPGTVGPTSDLHLVGDSFVFVASSAGASLLKLQAAKKKLPQQQPPLKCARLSDDVDGAHGSMELNALRQELLSAYDELRDVQRQIRSFSVTVVDEMAFLGTIHNMAPWCREKEKEEEDDEDTGLCGTMRFICGNNWGGRGSLCVLQRAVPFDVITDFDLRPGFSAAWAIPKPPEQPLIAPADGAAAGQLGPGAKAGEPARAEDETHGVLLLTGRTGSMVLEVAQEINEISNSTVLDTSCATMCAGTLLQGQLVVQLTQDHMRFMWAGSPKEKDVPASVPVVGGNDTALARAGSVCDPFVLAVLDDETLRLFAASAGAQVQDVTEQLPAGASRPVTCASLFHSKPSGLTLLVVVVPSDDGTLKLVDLKSMTVVYCVASLSFAPALLRSSPLEQDDSDDGAGGGAGAGGGGARVGLNNESLDAWRSISDPCASLRNGVKQGGFRDTLADELMLEHLRMVGDLCAPAPLHPPPAGEEDEPVPPLYGQQPGKDPVILCAELVEVDPQDSGPTLVLLIVGRPILVYRSFVPSRLSTVRPGSPDPRSATFPYHFTLWDHEFLTALDWPPVGPYRPVVPVRHGRGCANGAVVVPPHAGVPSLWLTASRNRLYMHPLAGTNTRGFAPINAPCCKKGFIALMQKDALPQSSTAAVSAQLCTLGAVQGIKAGFELQHPMPCALHALGRTPHHVATRPEDGHIAVAVSEAVLEQPDQAAGPSMEEDPLSEDWSIIREPPVTLEPAPMPRLQPRFELWITNQRNFAKLSQYRFSFDADEHVLSMAWVEITGFPSPSLAVGTGVNTGEDLTCRGRLLLFSTKDRQDGILPAIYQRALKWPVTVVGQWGGYLVHSEGFKLFFERWEGTSFNKLAFYDGTMCLTSMSSIKSFLLVGDLRKGLEFVQWKEGSESQTRNLRRLSKSPPQVSVSVLNCEFIVCGKSLGMVALDHQGVIHLYTYSPHSDGREGDQLLQSCSAFCMGSPCRAVLRLPTEVGVQALLIGSGTGDLRVLKPVHIQGFRQLSALIGILATRLPFRCGLNPRAFRYHEGPPALVAPRRNIEDAFLLRLFFFLSKPVQDAVAKHMRMTIPQITKVVMPFAACPLSTMVPAASGASAAGTAVMPALKN